MENLIAPAGTLREAARRSWRHFLPIWAVPVLYFWVPLLPGFGRHLYAYLVLLVAPMFFLAWFISHRPLRVGTITLAQYVVLGIVVPFAIWVCVVGGFFAIAFLAPYLRAS